MNLKSMILCAALSALPALAAPPATTVAPGKPAEGTFHRVELKGGPGQVLPYTIEVPIDWQVRQDPGYPGLWIGPADAKPPEDPRLVWVRGSKVSMAKPDEIVANIRANDAAHADWSAPRVEVKEVGGVKGVLVQMDTGEGDKARSSLTLKLPLTDLALDFMTSASRTEFPQRLPLYERILLSVRPVASAGTAKK
jgi:hypothetical protein